MKRFATIAAAAAVTAFAATSAQAIIDGHTLDFVGEINGVAVYDLSIQFDDARNYVTTQIDINLSSGTINEVPHPLANPLDPTAGDRLSELLWPAFTQLENDTAFRWDFIGTEGDAWVRTDTSWFGTFGNTTGVPSGDILIARIGVSPDAEFTVDGFSLLAGQDVGEETPFSFIVPIPEPASAALLGLGGLLIARRRRA